MFTRAFAPNLGECALSGSMTRPAERAAATGPARRTRQEVARAPRHVRRPPSGNDHSPRASPWRGRADLRHGPQAQNASPEEFKHDLSESHARRDPCRSSRSLRPPCPQCRPARLPVIRDPHGKRPSAHRHRNRGVQVGHLPLDSLQLVRVRQPRAQHARLGRRLHANRGRSGDAKGQRLLRRKLLLADGPHRGGQRQRHRRRRPGGRTRRATATRPRGRSTSRSRPARWSSGLRRPRYLPSRR